MRLLTNPGSNLSSELITRYGFAILPQHIVVDGVVHDTREPIAFALVDRWAKESKRWPDTVGTTAAETVAAFDEALRAGETELLVLTSSKKIINSFQSAETAKRTITGSPQGANAKIEVIDSGATDVGAGLCCIFAGETHRAGHSIEAVASRTAAAARGIVMFLAVENLENMVKGGRASFLRAWLADVLGMRPLLGFVDGALQAVAKYSLKGDLPKRVGEELASRLPSKAGAGKRRVWLGIGHAGNREKALQVEQQLRAQFDVVFVYTRPIAAGVYLHTGRGAVCVAVLPVDDLGWSVPTPADVVAG